MQQQQQQCMMCVGGRSNICMTNVGPTLLDRVGRLIVLSVCKQYSHTTHTEQSAAKLQISNCDHCEAVIVSFTVVKEWFV